MVGVVLGSGLGSFANELSDREELAFRDIPDFPISTAIGHAGRFVFGRLDGQQVAVMSGRVHLYEGYTAREVTAGVRLLHKRGVRSLVTTNASGAVNTSFSPGELILIRDHINLQGANPLVGLRSGFPDMTEAYSLRLRAIARRASEELGFPLRDGVYAALLGPSYETPAEIRYLAAIGADLVGMSTALEVIQANALGMEVLGISCVTNFAAGLGAGKLHHEDVLETGRKSQERLIAVLRTVLPRMRG